MKKATWLLVSCLIVAALVLSSCATASDTVSTPATTATSTTKDTSTGQTMTAKVQDAPATVEITPEPGAVMVANIWGNMVEEPQYGGTIRYRVGPPSIEHYDPLWWAANATNAVINDRLATAPWEKGPEGDGTYGLDYSSYTVDVYRGELLVRWEQYDLFSCLFELKQGIRFWDKAPVNGREVTVDDEIWTWIRYGRNLQSNWYWSEGEAASFWNTELDKVDSGKWPMSKVTDWFDQMENIWLPQISASGYDPDDVEVTKRFPAVLAAFADHGIDVPDGVPLGSSYLERVDKYTLIKHNWSADVEIWNDLTSFWILPREVEEEFGNFDNWQTVVSMGAWIPTDYVRDSAATYKRNPNYWGVDPNLPKNQLPYADRLITLAILDQSTYLAALRTAKVDMGVVVWHQVETFKETNPEMLHVSMAPVQTHTYSVRNDIEPWSDIRVRKAAMLAIDQPAILNDLYEGNAFAYTWPIQHVFPAVYTPYEEWPTDLQELYQYHPDKARSLLAEAGYPNGFQTKMYVYPSADDRESSLVVAEYLADVGIDVEVVITETASFVEILYGREYDGMISCWWGNNFTMDALDWAEGGQVSSPYNFGNVVDDSLVAFSDYYGEEEDLVLRDVKLKEINLYELGQVYNLVIPIPVSTRFWWPWMKGYSGQMDLGWPDETNWGEIPKYIWIDQDLKFEIAGKRD